MLERSFDGAAINRLVNDPTIRPFVGGDISQPLDLSSAIIERNVFLLGEHGGFALIWTSPATFEVHTFILPSGRGRWALRATQVGIAIMKDWFGAKQLWTRVEENAAATRLFTRAAGMWPAGREIFDIGGGPKIYQIYEWRT